LLVNMVAAVVVGRSARAGDGDMTTPSTARRPPVHTALEPDRPKRRARFEREQIGFTASCAPRPSVLA